MIDACTTQTLLSIEQALQKIEAAVTPLKTSEYIRLKNALGRILSVSVYSPIHIPPYKRATMDGYAFANANIVGNQSFSLTLVGQSLAGSPYGQPLKNGECIRIFTGAVLPEGADSVIMQEHIDRDETTIILPATTHAHDNINVVGADVRQGERLLLAGKKLNTHHIGLLAAAGIVEVWVKRKINIAFLCTGDELAVAGQALQLGQIYDSNRYALNSLLSDSTINRTDLGNIADDKQAIETCLLAAATSQDVLISTGGASVGEADYIKEIVGKCGNINFWKIAIKPGKPLIFGKIKHCYFFGLPGNPVSVMTTFYKVVLPALQILSGVTPLKKTMQLHAICTSPLSKAKGRQEYQRGILTQHKEAEFLVKSAGKQGSNMMSSMSAANCYIVLAPECEAVAAGEKVIVEPFDVLI